MKEVTIPITPRQLGWIISCALSGLLFLHFGLASSFNMEVMGIMSIVFSPLVMCMFWVDGHYDLNPLHHIGYCLRLKENTKSHDRNGVEK